MPGKHPDPRAARLKRAIEIAEAFRHGVGRRLGGLEQLRQLELSEELEEIKRGRRGRRPRVKPASARRPGRPTKLPPEFYELVIEVHARGEQLLRQQGVERPRKGMAFRAACLEMARACGETQAEWRAIAVRLARRYSDAVQSSPRTPREITTNKALFSAAHPSILWCNDAGHLLRVKKVR